MAESTEARTIQFEDVAAALEIVGLLLRQLTIPATRADEFAVVSRVLGEIKGFVDSRIAASKVQSDTTEVATETAPPVTSE